MGGGIRDFWLRKRLALGRKQVSEQDEDTHIQIKPQVAELESTLIHTTANDVDQKIASVDEGCECSPAINEEVAERMGVPSWSISPRAIKGATPGIVDVSAKGIAKFRLEIGGYGELVCACNP
jgi:hypothetical protein